MTKDGGTGSGVERAEGTGPDLDGRSVDDGEDRGGSRGSPRRGLVRDEPPPPGRTERGETVNQRETGVTHTHNRRTTEGGPLSSSLGDSVLSMSHQRSPIF